MKNIIEFIKDKSYYFLGGTVIIFILIIILGSCSNKSGSSYEKIEKNMITAATQYYSTRKDKLPNTEGGTVKVTIGTLVDAELMEEAIDPKNSSKKCSGYVEVTKVGEKYSYIPFLTCAGNYEPKYLTDIVREVKKDEYGNGVYTINNELVYKGADAKNYVRFNNQTWRIVKVDSEGDIKLVLIDKLPDTYSWDTAYNSEKEGNVGVTTDYLHTDIRKTLTNFYETNFNSDSKAKIVTKDLCVGKYEKTGIYGSETEDFSVEKECSIIKENEKVGLLTASDYQNASLDTKCITLKSKECGNYNYLAREEINTWLLTSSSANSYKVLYLSMVINESNASSTKRINPVIYITSKSVVASGTGSLEDPYIIK